MLTSERSYSASYGQASLNLRLFEFSHLGEKVGLVVCGPTDVPRVVGVGLLPIAKARALFREQVSSFEKRYRTERTLAHDI
jgi:hypothetical protein